VSATVLAQVVAWTRRAVVNASRGSWRNRGRGV